MAWQIDPTHTQVQFAVRHMGLSTIRGHFAQAEGRFELAEGLPRSVEVAIDPASIETRNAQRNQHLLSADFFDAAQFPAITFRGRSTERTGPDSYRIDGELTLHGVTRPVSLETETTQPIKDPYGLRRIGLKARARINRKDFGLNWNMALDSGADMVGEQVEIDVDAEAVEAQDTSAGS